MNGKQAKKYRFLAAHYPTPENEPREGYAFTNDRWKQYPVLVAGRPVMDHQGKPMYFMAWVYTAHCVGERAIFKILKKAHKRGVWSNLPKSAAVWNGFDQLRALHQAAKQSEAMESGTKTAQPPKTLTFAELAELCGTIEKGAMDK